MTLWIDAQISPEIASFITWNFNITCTPVRDIGLKEATDKDIFLAAKEANIVLITKDSDFIDLLLKYNSPPKIIWLTCGNTSNEYLKIILKNKLLITLKLLNEENDIVELTN
jgi:predicted nuclease of predicted toxin-antitoxin system